MYGGSLEGTTMVTIEASSFPVERLRMVFATQFYRRVKPDCE